MTTIQAVIEESCGRFARMRELNTRAGRDVFLVPSKEQLAASLQQFLRGAARLADIRWPETLRLPALDAAAEAGVLAECPDTIVVCGREVAVEYRAPYYGTQYPSRVRVDFRGEQAKDWLQLPEGGITLPDGREVTIVAPVEGCGWYEVEAPSSQFKGKVQEHLNQGLWDSWQKPTLDVPAIEDNFPALVEHEYAKCVVTSEQLVAYGVLYHDYYSGWKTAWYRDRAEAERKHAEGSAKWLELKEKAERDELKKRVRTLMDQWYYTQDFDDMLRKRLYNTVYGYTGAAQTVAELTSLIAKAEVSVTAYEAQKAEEERLRREAEARRESVEAAINDLLDGAYADGHIWVPEAGEVAYILAGKTSKIGDLVVLPTAGETLYSGPWCFGNSKYRKWVPFTYGVRAKAQEYSGRGNLQHEVALYLSEGVLEPGVYGVASDGEGQFFYPVIHHAADGTEVVPEVSAVKKYRSPKHDASAVAKGTDKPASEDALAALAAKFGR